MKPIVQSPVLRFLAATTFYASGRFLEAADAADARDRRKVAVAPGASVVLVRPLDFECLVSGDHAGCPPPVTGWTVDSHDTERGTYKLRHATLKTTSGHPAWLRVWREDFAIPIGEEKRPHG